MSGLLIININGENARPPMRARRAALRRSDRRPESAMVTARGRADLAPAAGFAAGNGQTTR